MKLKRALLPVQRVEAQTKFLKIIKQTVAELCNIRMNVGLLCH